MGSLWVLVPFMRSMGRLEVCSKVGLKNVATCPFFRTTFEFYDTSPDPLSR